LAPDGKLPVDSTFAAPLDPLTSGWLAMTLTPALRKFALTAHVTSSVGWLGAVAGFLALAIAGLASHDAQLVRAAYLAMELTGWCVIVPLSLASLLSGLVQSLGTKWGLFRHYWILAKLLITVVATIILLLHMQPTSRLAAVAAETTLSSADLGGLRIQLVADSCAALAALVAATALAVYKPRGLTPYGQRLGSAKRSDQFGRVLGGDDTASTPQWVRVLGIIAGGIVLLFVLLHLAGLGLGGH
jgi:hypothetical protein